MDNETVWSFLLANINVFLGGWSIKKSLILCCRAISYLFHWHREKLIFRNIAHEHFSADFTDNLLLGFYKDLRNVYISMEN